MLPSISSYSYAGVIGENFTLFDAIDHAAKTGFKGIEFVPFEAPQDKTAAQFAGELREYCAKKDLAVVNYAVGGNFLCADSAAMEAEIERLSGEVDIAAELGAPFMRHDIAGAFPADYPHIKTFEAALPMLAKGARHVTEYATTKGVQTMTENHGFFCQDSNRVLKLVTAVGNANYGALCDIGNFCCVDEDSAKAVGVIAPIAKHVHVKDMFIKDGCKPNPGKGWFNSRSGNYIRCTILGHGDIPILPCLKIIKAAGYTGYLSLEFEGIEDVLSSIEISYENLMNYLGCL